MQVKLCGVKEHVPVFGWQKRWKKISSGMKLFPLRSLHEAAIIIPWEQLLQKVIDEPRRRND